MDCFIAKLSGYAGFETGVRFYSPSAKNYLRYYLESGMNLHHNDMHEILADARDIQKRYAEKDRVTPALLGNTQKGINRFLKKAPQEDIYRIKEFVPCPKKKY